MGKVVDVRDNTIGVLGIASPAHDVSDPHATIIVAVGTLGDPA